MARLIVGSYQFVRNKPQLVPHRSQKARSRCRLQVSYKIKKCILDIFFLYIFLKKIITDIRTGMMMHCIVSSPIIKLHGVSVHFYPSRTLPTEV